MATPAQFKGPVSKASPLEFEEMKEPQTMKAERRAVQNDHNQSSSTLHSDSIEEVHKSLAH